MASAKDELMLYVSIADCLLFHS